MSCSICLKEIVVNSSVLTPCNHRFCSKCFFKWIYTAKTCPLCRNLLIAEATSEEKKELEQIRSIVQEELEQLDDLLLEIDDLIEQRKNLKKDIIRQREKKRHICTELDFLTTIRNQKKKEIEEITPIRNRVRGPRIFRGRRMGQMWA